MDAEGYPEEHELEAIKSWDIKQFPELLEYVEERHAYPDYLQRSIAKDWRDIPILKWSFSTAGWSGNEDLINALLSNRLFKALWYYSWRRGGHYVFYIDPRQVGFELVTDYCKKNKVSRQWVSKSKTKFEHFKLSANKVFVRPIEYKPD